MFVLANRRHLGRKFVPELLRIMRQRKLGFAVVHHDDVAHTRCVVPVATPSASMTTTVKPSHDKSCRAGCPDDACTDDGDIKRFHFCRPKRNGSLSSSISSIRAITCAEPVMIGMILSSSTLHAALENTPYNAFLPPNISLIEFSVGKEACELGTRTGSAWRSVVFKAGTKHEISAVRSSATGRKARCDRSRPHLLR